MSAVIPLTMPFSVSQDASTLASSMSEEETEKVNLAKLAGSQKVRGKELDGLDIVDVNADSALGGTSEIQVSGKARRIGVFERADSSKLVLSFSIYPSVSCISSPLPSLSPPLFLSPPSFLSSPILFFLTSFLPFAGKPPSRAICCGRIRIPSSTEERRRSVHRVQTQASNHVSRLSSQGARTAA